MIERIKVCAVIVLYNNPDEVNKCLQSLEKQNRPVDYYILIDNSESEFCKLNREIISGIGLSKDRYIYLMCKENKGSAFGFALGMWIADQKSFDLVWLNDQDGIADEYCLTNIMRSYEVDFGKTGIYVPNVCEGKTKKELAGFHVHINKFLHSGLSGSKGINSFGTTGVCITRETMKKIGYYNYYVCYIGNEDKEYALRARKSKLKIKYIENAIYYHPDAFDKYEMKRKIKKYFLLQYIIPLNMGFIIKDEEQDFRRYKVCVSSAYINYKYASFFFRNINFIYCFFKAFISRSCNLNVTLKAYKEGRQIALKKEDLIYDNKLQEFY